MTADPALGRELLMAMRAVARMGLFELNSGHISTRVPDSDLLLVPRHLHGAGAVGGIAELGEEDLVEVELATGRWRGVHEPPEEVHLHTAIYRARPDVRAVAHTHAEHPVALSVAGVPVLPVHHHGALFAPAVPILDDHRQISDAERGQSLADALGPAWALVMRAHGCVSVGRTLPEAVAVMFTLDQCARRQLLAACAGTPVPIPVPEGSRPTLSDSTVRNVWHEFAGVDAATHDRHLT